MATRVKGLGLRPAQPTPALHLQIASMTVTHGEVERQCAFQQDVKRRTGLQAGHNSQSDRESEKGVLRRGEQKAGTAGFTPHPMIDATHLAVDEIAGIQCSIIHLQYAVKKM